MKHPVCILFAGFVAAMTITGLGDFAIARGLHGGAATGGGGGGGGFIADVVVVNSSGSTVSNQPVTLAFAAATGDVSSANKFEVRKADGTTVVTAQEDGCSKWTQDSSRKVCSVSFVEPDSIAGAAQATYKVYSVSGSPSTTANLTTANITANTDIKVQTSNLMEADGTVETGTWDLVSINYVLASCRQYSGTTGYGPTTTDSDPKCGWEYYASGPNRVGIHAFQYPKRVSDNAFQKWIRTDIWVDFWGSGSTPCPCSIAYQESQPNSWGAINGSTVGETVEASHVFGAQVLNGANVIYSLGGASDNRVVGLAPSAFTTGTSGVVTLPGGNWTEGIDGIFPVTFTSTGTLPAGITSGGVYWIRNNYLTPDAFKLYGAACEASNGCTIYFNYNNLGQYGNPGVPFPLETIGNTIELTYQGGATGYVTYVKLCPTSTCVATTSDTPLPYNTTISIAKGSNSYIAFYDASCLSPGYCFSIGTYKTTVTTQGTGTISMIPQTQIMPYTGYMGLDDKAQRFWINTSGTAMTAPPVMIAQNFNYLTQQSKATPPYINNSTTLQGHLQTVTALSYYPNSWYTDYDLNQFGDDVGDVRVGYIDHWGAYSLFMPNDPNPQQNSRVFAASFSAEHMYHIDEHVGLPPVYNGGPDKSETTRYPTMGVDQPSVVAIYARQTPSGWQNISANLVDYDPFSERYGTWLDPSHLPLPSQAPYLKSGLPEWTNQMVFEVNAFVGDEAVQKIALGGTNYYRVLSPTSYALNQTRGVAWGHKTEDQLNHFLSETDPFKPYLKDLINDDETYTDLVVATLDPKITTLGFFWYDTNLASFQLWQNDYLMFTYGMSAWRAENSHVVNFATTYLSKMGVARGDSASSVGGGGCQIAGSARQISPFGSGTTISTLPTTWGGLWSNTSANDPLAYPYGHFTGLGTWPGCSTTINGYVNFLPDDTTAAYPSSGGLVTDMTVSAAIGSLIGVPHAASLYSTIRTIAYNGPYTGYYAPQPLSFVDYYSHSVHWSSPEMAIGILGATE